MPKRIQEDHRHFRDVIEGKTRRELKRLIKSGGFVRKRGKNGRFQIKIDKLEIPRFYFGDTGERLGRGPGKKGQVVKRDPQEGEGNEAGDEHEDGMVVSLDMDDVLRFLQDELGLPEMKPKPSETYEEVKIVYNDISRTGPDSLRHNRRTLLEALKRLAMTDDLDNLHLLPGNTVPIKLITPINSDRRYRQYQEIKIPSSNAVIFFARDCSGSMDDYRCDIVSDMAWWIDCWIRKFYERVERCYLVHDTDSMEVDEEKFYRYREGGGTMCSSAFKHIAEMLENRFPPHKYNVYIFYFTDGDNWGGDNEKLIETVKTQLGANIVNLIGFTQICPYRYDGSLKTQVDQAIASNQLDGEYISTFNIGNDESPDKVTSSGRGGMLATEDRDAQIIAAIKAHLGKEKHAK